MEQENNFSFRQNTGRKNLLEIIKNFLRHNNKLVIVVIIVLALTLPFIVNQVLKQQDLRQRASSFPPLTFAFDPSSDSLQVGYIKQFSLLLTTDVNDVGSVNVTVSYDPAIVKVKASSFGTALQAYSDSNDNGTYTLTLLNPTNTKVTGSNLKVITFDVEGIKIGSTALSIKSIQATVSGSDQYAIINNSTNIQAPINVTSVQPTPNPGTPALTGPVSPTPDACIAPTGLLPNGCSCTNDNQCYGGKCKPDGQGGGICTDYLTPTVPPPTNYPTIIMSPTPFPTATLAPTAPPIANDTLLNLSFDLPGIGVGAPSLGLNSTPVHPQRKAKVEIYDSADKIVTIGEVVLTNTKETQYYGSLSLGPTFNTGSYSVKIKIDNSLVKRLPGVVQITNGQKASTYHNAGTLVTGDLNNDNTLGVIDWTLMIACIKDEAACTPDVRNVADLNDNGDVDEYDVQILQRGFAIRNGD